MAGLLNIQIIASSNSFMEYFEFQEPAIFQPLLIKRIQRHCEVLRLEVPIRITVRLDLISLNKLTILLILERWLHIDERIWFLIRIQRIFDSHSVINFKINRHILSCFMSLHIVYNSSVNVRFSIIVAWVLIHELRKFSQKNNVIYVTSFQTVCDKIHIERLHFFYCGCVRLNVRIFYI